MASSWTTHFHPLEVSQSASQSVSQSVSHAHMVHAVCVCMYVARRTSSSFLAAECDETLILVDDQVLGKKQFDIDVMLGVFPGASENKQHHDL